MSKKIFSSRVERHFFRHLLYHRIILDVYLEIGKWVVIAIRFQALIVTIAMINCDK
jgi:hypothetical protein